jgi:phenylacetate-CoA ligase
MPHFEIQELEKKLKNDSESEWMLDGSKKALSLFHEMAERVPAYRAFLDKHQFNPQAVETVEDMKKVPPVDKDSYLRIYHRNELCWDGDFRGKSWVISATSGSTGVPYYFPRMKKQDEDYAKTAELYLRQNFNIQEKSTLYINAFPMGVWIGGVFTYEAIKQVTDKGYNLSIITPGINKLEVIRAVQNLGHDFDQIIIGSYAPFLKDILDDGVNNGLEWKDYNLGFVFSAEAFSEEFRDYVIEKVGLKHPYSSTLNHYGTVDLGTMAHETPLSILIRRFALKSPKIYEALFKGASKLPTLAQFDPTMFYFEENDGNLFCSSYSGLPLFRYDLKDHGGVLKRSEIDTIFAQNNIDLAKEIVNAGIEGSIWNLPFVYVFERSDFSVSFFAFQIYPESIRKALLEQELPNKVTGKCAMHVTYDAEGVQQFIVHVELMSGISASDELSERIAEIVQRRLLNENSEYRKTSEEVGLTRVRPLIQLWPYEHPDYFKVGGKQKWIIKDK